MTEYTREDLIAICEKAVVPVDKWRNRDSASAQTQLGKCWALLSAGADFTVSQTGTSTGGRTIWLDIEWPGFKAFEYGSADRDVWESGTFYLPTPARLAEADGKDWY